LNATGEVAQPQAANSEATAATFIIMFMLWFLFDVVDQRHHVRISAPHEPPLRQGLYQTEAAKGKPPTIWRFHNFTLGCRTFAPPPPARAQTLGVQLQTRMVPAQTPHRKSFAPTRYRLRSHAASRASATGNRDQTLSAIGPIRTKAHDPSTAGCEHAIIQSATHPENRNGAAFSNRFHPAATASNAAQTPAMFHTT